MILIVSSQAIRIGIKKNLKNSPRCFSMKTKPLKLESQDSQQLLNRIAELNECDINKQKEYIPFMIGGVIYGFVKPSTCQHLKPYKDIFTFIDDSFTAATKEIHLANSLLESSIEERSSQFHAVSENLLQLGVITKREWRSEMVPVKRRFSDEPTILIERAAYPIFGLKGYGVHINGYVTDSDTGRPSHLWVAKRSANKSTFPSMLDHIVAGGQPYGVSPAENVIKECAEEANIPEELASTARAVSAVSYVGIDDKANMKRDVLFCYDLELPFDFTPKPCDGEVESFELQSMEWVLEKVLEGGSKGYKPNCNLVVIDFLIRHGFICGDTPQFLDIVSGLRGGECS